MTTPYEARDGKLHYLVTAADGTMRSTEVPDTPEARWYLGWSVRAPLAHQVKDFIRFRDGQTVPGVGLIQAFALFYEQRARKTKVALDVFRYRYEKGDVDALVVVSYPSDVKFVWADELKKDFPLDLLEKMKVLVWRANVVNKTNREETLSLRSHPGPILVSINCEAIARSKKAWEYLEWLLKRRRVMLVADEAAWMANWTAQTQKAEVLSRRPAVVIKAILDGTPVEEGPGEIYHPAKFLHPRLLGFATKEAFKARYFEYEEEEVLETVPGLTSCAHCGGQDASCFACAGTGQVQAQVPTGRVIRQRVKRQQHQRGGGGKIISEFDSFIGYRNCEELEAKLKTFGSRVRRADVSDAPSKTYQSRYFELSPLQRRVYDDLRTRYIAEVEGETVRATNVLLRMTRLQMIARGYYPPERTGETCGRCQGEGFINDEECMTCDGLGLIVRTTTLRRIDPSSNPAGVALGEELRVAGGPAIVWCRFRQDVLDSLDVARELGGQFFRYDGGVPESEREDAYQRFKAGEGDGIVATIGSGLQRGKDLSRAALLVYYSNDFSLRRRRQSEDRAESLDRRVSTGVTDLVAADTRDLTAIEALRAKKNIAELIMGDPPSKWI